MQFVDLAAQQERIRSEIEAKIRLVLDHGQYIMGPEVRELEERLAAYVGVKHAVACSSGTDALLLALMAYEVGPGDGVLTTPFTFIATAEVISLLGAVPVFVDIDRETFNISPDQVEKAISAVRERDHSIHPVPKGYQHPIRIKGIIPVDLFGLPADYDRINSIAQEYGLFVIEDAAQSFGAEYNGKKACSLASVGCTSFFPAKPLGGYGDGGMCFTDREDLAKKMSSLRLHGQGDDRYDNVRVGINGRLDTVQAAILLAKFEIFPEEVELRQQVAESYTRLLSSRTNELSTPLVPSGRKSVWAQYSVMAQNEGHRSTLLANLKKSGIPFAIYYPKPLHLQQAFSSLGYSEGDFPVSESVSRRIFSLPMHPYLDRADQERIIDCLIGVEDGR